LEENVRNFIELLESINQQLNNYANTIVELDAQDASKLWFLKRNNLKGQFFSKGK